MAHENTKIRLPQGGDKLVVAAGGTIESESGQHSSTGQTSGFTAGAGTAVLSDSTFTGGTGTKAYTIGDVVKALKGLGILASS